MLSYLLGERMHVATVATGATVEINPSGSSSNWNGTFSPDSRKLAFLSDAGGVPQVWIADVATGAARPVSGARIFLKMWNCLDRPVWSRDGAAIYALVVEDIAGPLASNDGATHVTVKVQASGAESGAAASEMKNANSDPTGINVTASSVERIDIASGARLRLIATQGEAQPYAYEISPSERWVSYLTAKSGLDSKYELFASPASGGSARSFGLVDQIVYDGPAVSQVYSPAFHWAPGRDLLVFVQGGGIWSADLSKDPTARPVRLAPELGKIAAASMAASTRLDQLGFTSSGDTVVARLADQGDLVFAIVPLNGSAARRLALPTQFQYLGMVFASRDVLWQPTGADFVLRGSDLTTGKQLAIRADLTTGKSITIMEQAANFDFVSAVSPETIVGTFTDAKTPPDLYAFSDSLRARRRISHVNPAVARVGLDHSVSFTTRVPSYDGSMRTLRTSVLLPANYQRGWCPPGIVDIYPDAEFSKRANEFGGGRLAGGELALFWTSRGYAVVLPDLAPLTPQVTGGGNVIREIRDYLLPQISTAAALGYIDLDQVVLTGHSYGGYATTAVLTETSLFRAGVAYSPAPLDLLSTSWTEWPGRLARIGIGANPWDSFKQYLTNSPYQQADKIRTPILFIHGTEDNVSSESSETMFRGLQQL
jgi:dipeptidyl aminopeptidase/acylaminoacyl peptidase